MRKKITLKILTLFPVLFLLTGCSDDFKHYSWTNIGSLPQIINEWTNEIWLGIVEGVNGFYSILIQIVRAAAATQNGLARYFLNRYTPGLANIITTVSFLAIAFIIVNFAKSVYQNNMARTDNVNAPSAIQLVKKLFVAVLATFIVPYVVISAFGLSTYAGDALYTAISQATSDELDENKTTVADNIWSVYTEMNKDHVNTCTRCEIGQRLAGVTNTSNLLGTKDLKNPLHNQYYQILYESDGELYNKWCNYNPGSTSKNFSYDLENKTYYSKDALEEFQNYAPLNIYESLKYSNSYYRTVLITGYQQPTKVTDADQPSVITFIQNAESAIPIVPVITGILLFLGSGIAIVLIFFMIIKRVIEVISLIGTSWYYIGASICDQEGKTALSDLWKKLLKICLTQFIITFEFFLYVDLCLSQGPSLLNAIETIVWILFISATPSAVEELVSSSGTAEGAASAGKAGVRALASFFGGRN